MIYYSNSLDAVIESIYLGEGLEDSLGRCNIIVNPVNLNYMSGKIAIINDYNYSWNSVSQLVETGSKVISRVHTNIPGVNYQPYILRVNQRIRWNGEILDLRGKKYKTQEILSLLCGEDQKFKYDVEKQELYFPKILTETGTKDSLGDLSCLGWALQQVGINIKTDTKFTDLDVVKTMKWCILRS